jgi:hypothetical protein
MNDLKKFFDGFSNLNGAKFITLNGYISEAGEVANHNILVNINVMNAKVSDNKTLHNTSAEVISKKSAKTFALDIFTIALCEMITSSDKNISENKEDRTVQSQAQTDAYIQIGKGLKLHKETGMIHVFGFKNQKKVLVPGVYKPVNSSDKTLAKKEITKVLKLRSGKFQTFKIAQIESVKMEGKTLIINCAK